MQILKTLLQKELALIWAGHRAVGIEGGFMSFYTIASQDPWRNKEEGWCFWFDEAHTDAAIDQVIVLYRNGALPNTTPLLNPIIHALQPDGSYQAVGSGVFWATSFALGIATLTRDQIIRPHDKGVCASHVHRGDNHGAGIKMLGFSKEMLPPKEREGMMVVDGCRELYNLVNSSSPSYWGYYILSGMSYLCLHGMFLHPSIDQLFPEDITECTPEEVVRNHQVDIQLVLDAEQCWEAYDRLHTLYMHFGQDTRHIEHNNRFFNLCARDLDLFDRTGPMRIGSDETFEFIVPGLIPRGAVTLLAAPGGTGKSSVAHQLCVQAAIDWRDGEARPLWLGQPLNDDVCKGICVYFSGEDGPAIINARGALFDPEGRALRLQFHRNEFHEKEITFGEYLLALRRMPNVSLVVVDPARKYLSGDENDADVVSEFFEAIEEFAISKKCGMIVVHHLQKGARPKNTREVLDELRGSQVFIDRPRVVIGMCRDEKHTIVGLAKCNIPPTLGMITEERIFTRNPKNLELIWLPGESGVRRDYLTKEELDALELAEFQAQLEPQNQGHTEG